ncbi:DMT family transporter [Spelaeicoccus albus]|uniref:Drug/metabolite transporter (DMT)-like permease n=1 Tax=Spelaeicoccus albus TaxID=1280376 RepID=A0A7Z0AB64_9MICO|nr:DMT family transporter [Spelaeicoccus albus]NYI66418.1 drug/metabolite transporter (DMT)-like permease [Spelaeicoccus albus]
MSLTVAIIFALASAGCAAIASVLQHRTARAAPGGRGLRIGLIASLLRRPLWLVGVSAAGAAFLFHAAALQGGQLAIVQPLLVSSLLFALPATALLDKRRPSITEWTWALLLIVGLGLFLGFARPTAGTALPNLSVFIPALALAGALTATSVFLGAVPLRRYRPALFGFATGTAYGIVAALIKYVVGIGVSDPIRVLTDWPLYVLVVVGAFGVVLNQTAYQAGSLAAALPPLALSDPVVAALLGVVAFGEQMTTTPIAVIGQIIGAVLAGTAAVTLARREAHDMRDDAGRVGGP